MESLRHTFTKEERLCSQKMIDDLFASSNRLMVFPYSIHWKLYPSGTLPAPAQVLITTSKRKFHHAVDRNRVKRLTRECYRLHKSELYQCLQQRQQQLVLSVNYIHDDIFDYPTLYRKFDKVVAQLCNEIQQAQ